MTDVFVPLEQEGTEAVVSRWLFAVGDRIEADAPLVELETDKVTVEVPALVAGVLAEILIQPGAEAKPGEVLARIDPAAEEEVPAMKAAPAPEPGPVPGRAVETRHSPAVRKALAETGLDPEGITGTGRDGRLTRDDVRSAP